MLLVEVFYKKDIRNEDAIERAFITLSAILPETVATALSCDHPDGRLTEDDVEARFMESNPVFDVTKNDIDIVIFANFYPQRGEIVDAGRDAITKRLGETMPPGLKFSIWILLPSGSFAEFET